MTCCSARLAALASESQAHGEKAAPGVHSRKETPSLDSTGANQDAGEAVSQTQEPATGSWDPPVQGRDACNHGWVTTTAHTVLVPGCLRPQPEATRRIVGRLAVHEKDTMVEPGGGGRVLLNPSSMRSPLGTPLPLSAKHDACLATCQLQSRVRGMD